MLQPCLQDSRPLRTLLPFNLMYYDELANQDELINVTVRLVLCLGFLRNSFNCILLSNGSASVGPEL
jgi:hypothetical protein